MSQTLDITTLPLHGSRLIEASAGTGKTWAIAAIYLRLVLGHGNEHTRFHRPLLPSEILVMTFTRAATRELSDRIRNRLTEAARCFRGDVEAQADDEVLGELLAAYPDKVERDQAARRLALAAEAMDDAAISTIDAWCQRMLREHAFDSGAHFEEALVADEQALQLVAAQDYWRQQTYGLTDRQLELVQRQWPGFGALFEDVRHLLGKPIDHQPFEGALADCIDQIQIPVDQALQTLAVGWEQRASSMKTWLDSQIASHTAHWNRVKLPVASYPGWLQHLQEWARDPLNSRFKTRGDDVLGLGGTARKRLTADGLLDARNSKAPSVDLPDEFEAFAQLIAEAGQLPDLGPHLRAHAVFHIGQRLSVLKRQARSFGFLDMQQRLDQALQGDHGQALRDRIVRQFPVALIDEFQDTSPLQYRIFDALYQSESSDPDTALLLIGDPKQSIYGFRGADIYSYLQARRATAGRHYVQDTNYRSTQALVQAVNSWFLRAEEGAGSGAFDFRTEATNDLPFEPVAARGRDERLVSAQAELAAITILHDLEPRTQAVSRLRLAALCAEQIVTWLNDEAVGFRHADGNFRRLRPADIAVLVRTGTEAAAIRDELRRRLVPSVYLSDRDSVFDSPEAADLLRWLRAVASPRNARLARAGLATGLIGLSIDALATLAADDAAFDARSETLQALHDIWRQQGVLAMLRQTLHGFDLPAHWLGQPDGERRLTNVLHLAELLQQASVGLDGQPALIRWLAMQIRQRAAGDDDERTVRLESDAELVKVVTIFKSKGLEYPLVFLPFACQHREVEGKNSFVLLPGASGLRETKLSINRADLELAQRERLRDDLRLFYVALTRARHALWLGFANLGSQSTPLTHRSAAGFLLGGAAANGDWLAALQALAANAAERAREMDGHDASPIALQAAPTTAGSTELRAHLEQPVLSDGQVYTASFERNWSLGSFSSLVRDLGGAAPVPPAASADIELLPAHAAASTEQANPVAPIEAMPASASDLLPMQAHRPAADEGDEPCPQGARAQPDTGADHTPWHRFPRGASSGDFLHATLEWLASENFELAGNEARQKELLARCARAGRGEWADAVRDWMRVLLDTRLPSLDAPLHKLSTHQIELEFWMPSERLPTRQVDALCMQLLDGEPRPALPRRELHGMLMGFADLVFEHEGRYWVLDYKSNSLGAGGADYDRAALQSAMASHRYDVQAAIYLLALHRLLRARLGEHYQPEHHLGGAIYLFIRGIDGPVHGEYAIPATAPVRELILTLDRLLGEEAQTA